MTRIVYGLLLLLMAVKALSQAALQYAVDNIPAHLIKGASMVIRESEKVMEIRDQKHIQWKVKTVATILNNSNPDLAKIIIPYSKSERIESLKITIYDHSGLEVREVPQKEVMDLNSWGSRSTWYYDMRVKYYNPTYTEMPFTVKYEYECRARNSLYFPTWYPQSSPLISVENSKYIVKTMAPFAIRVKENNFTGTRTENFVEGAVISNFEVRNLPALVPECYSLPFTATCAAISIAPVNFSYEGITGSMTSWEDYGKWTWNNLLQNRDSLPSSTYYYIQNLVKDLSDPSDKIRTIYKFVQTKTRYVSIVKGIGGIQPMTAAEVDQLGYGDCKALTNYTLALLKVAGIHSIYAEIYGGNEKQDILPDFPSLQGNHVVLCVPLNADTIWLECTSKTAPMGYLGTFVDNRNAILCTANGAVIATTKAYPYSGNIIDRHLTVRVDTLGNLSGIAKHRYSGQFYSDREHYFDKSKATQIKMLAREMSIEDLSVMDYSLNADGEKEASCLETLDFKISGYGSLRKEKMLLSLFPQYQQQSIPVLKEDRVAPIAIQRGWVKKYEIICDLPNGYKLESLPKPVNIDNKIGSYHAVTSCENNQLILNTVFVLKEGLHPVAEYSALAALYRAVKNTESLRFVLSRR